MSSEHHRAARTSAALLSLLLVVFAAGACGGSERPSAAGPGGSSAEGQSAGGGSIQVSAIEFEFSTGSVTAASGDSLELANKGQIEHDFSVEGADVMIHAAPGDTATGTLDLEPGDYTFFCSIPGHREAGMEGSLTVE